MRFLGIQLNSNDLRAYGVASTLSLALHAAFFCTLIFAARSSLNSRDLKQVRNVGVGSASGLVLMDVAFEPQQVGVTESSGSVNDAETSSTIAPSTIAPSTISSLTISESTGPLDRAEQTAKIGSDFSSASAFKARPAVSTTKLKERVPQVNQQQVDRREADRRPADTQQAAEGSEGVRGLNGGVSSSHFSDFSPYGSSWSAQRAGVKFGPKPPYPVAARRAGFEGAVVLRVVIDETGAPKLAEIKQSSGREDCDESAQRTIRNKWQFEPNLALQQTAQGDRHDERLVVVQYLLNG